MDKNIVTYSRTLAIKLTSICSADTKHNILDQSVNELAVPYHTILMSQVAKKNGAREVMLISGERPDSYAAVRARLEQWGFHSFAEYIYTVAELVFLEGLLPNICVGFLSKTELQLLHKIVVAQTIMIDSFDENIRKKHCPKISLESRYKMIANAGEVKMPVTINLVVGMGETLKSFKDGLEKLKELHLKYGNIQNIVLNNFIPEKDTPFEKHKPVTKTEMLKAVQTVMAILPGDIKISVPVLMNSKDITSFISKGVRDLGQVFLNDDGRENEKNKKIINEITTKLKKKGLGLQRRLPIFSKFIIEEWYSRKVGQLLDKYKLLLKQSQDAATDDEDE